MATLDDDSIRSLMITANAGDKAAYKSVLEEVERWATHFYRRRVALAAVNDLVQEILIAVHGKRHTYNNTQPFWPWVVAIARYKWADYLRDIYRRSEVELPDDLAAEEAGDSLDVAMSLQSLIERLKPSQAMVINLVKLQGYSVQETASATGQSEALVRVNIHRGLKQLIEFIEHADYAK